MGPYHLQRRNTPRPNPIRTMPKNTWLSSRYFTISGTLPLPAQQGCLDQALDGYRSRTYLDGESSYIRAEAEEEIQRR